MRCLLLITLALSGCKGPCQETGFTLGIYSQESFSCHPEAKVEMSSLPPVHPNERPLLYGKCVCSPGGKK